MLPLLILSLVCFFALYLAMLTLLRRAAAAGARGAGQRARRPEEQLDRSLPPEDRPHPGQALGLRHKQPDWRFLVRSGRRPFPGQSKSPGRKPATPASEGRTRADWAHYNKDMGDLNDPYQAPPSTARRA